jgi:hypothetical protein
MNNERFFFQFFNFYDLFFIHFLYLTMKNMYDFMKIVLKSAKISLRVKIRNDKKN